MKGIALFLTNPRSIEEIALAIALALAIATAFAAALKFYFDLRGLIEDVKNRFFRKEKFQVRRTIIKTIAKDNQTQTIKLHALRVFKDQDQLTLDHSPEIVDPDDTRFANISDRFSIPGRIIETPEYELRVDFKDDEAPRARHDYTYITSHVVNETMQDMWGKPGIVISKPVGRDCLVVEFFCPPKWRYRRTEGGEPSIKVYFMRVEGSEKEEDREYIPDVDYGWFGKKRRRIILYGAYYLFDKDEGRTDWLRVTVKKPPQDVDIYVDWFWDDATEKLFQELEAAKSHSSASAPATQRVLDEIRPKSVPAVDIAQQIRGKQIRGTDG
jgi:hypothetical protein